MKRKGYIIVIEENRCGCDPSVYIDDVINTQLNKSMRRFLDWIADIEDPDCTEMEWLSDAMQEHPDDIKEEWLSSRYKKWEDTLVGDTLEIYIHEADINPQNN